jgi:triosephosphate isomerase
VTDANIDAYLTRPDIDGALVGTVSQQLTTFQALFNATITIYRRMQPGAGH